MTKSLLLLIALLPSIVFATDLVVADRLDLTSYWVGYTVLALFAIAYIFIGLLSAVIDNIPVMFAVLTMSPEMSNAQWMLVTLTAGFGGSLLSVGSAAGVALLGQPKGVYTFASHLKLMPFIVLGYIASVLVHMWLIKIPFV